MFGRVKSGSFKDGLIIALNPEKSIEELRIGQFSKIKGQIYDFIGMISDLRLSVSNPDVFIDPPFHDDLLTNSLKGIMLQSELEFFPLLSIDRNSNTIHSVKSIPGHFDPLMDVSQVDMDLIFLGSGEEKKTRFEIGTILTMEYQAAISLEKMVERSAGIFGSTGSGKTFFTRILLAGLIKHAVCSCLIFDFHEEYGVKGFSEEVSSVEGLGSLFPNHTVIYKVEKGEYLREKTIQISYQDITPEDIRLISSELHLSEHSYETAQTLRRKLGKNWIKTLLHLSADELDEEQASSWQVHPESLKALIRHLSVLKDLSFLADESSESNTNEIIQCLKKGLSIVIQFNTRRHQRLSYLLISSILTRRIYNDYRRASEENKNYKRLLIVIEEAHYFLSPDISRETIFGEIARELRKFNVTMLIIDQIPSQIDAEVLSQLGSRIIFHLNADKDIDSSLEGVQNKSKLKQILHSLDNKAEAMIMGYVVPIPLAFKARRYDTAFYRAMRSDDLLDEDMDLGAFFK
jgi:uncharacterized protein